MAKQFLTVTVMKLKITPEQGLQLGAKGTALAIVAFALMTALGVFTGHRLFHVADVLVPSLVGAAFLTMWTVFLVTNLKKKIPSMTRLLCWVSVVGLTVGFLVSTTI